MASNYNYKGLLLKLEIEHKDKINSLITEAKKQNTLKERIFSRNLDEIYDSYKGVTLAIVLDQILQIHKSVYDEVSKSQIEFKKFYNEKYEETCVYFEKINGLN